MAVAQVASLLPWSWCMHDRDVGIELDQRLDQLGQHDVVGVGRAPRLAWMITGASTDGGRLHDRQALLHVVDIEGGHAIAVLGGVVE